MAAYAELQVTSNFSFLRGGSHPEELVLRAAELGHRAIALTDRNTLAGVVRGHVAAKQAGIRFVVGARLDLEPGRPERSAAGPPFPSDATAVPEAVREKSRTLHLVESIHGDGTAAPGAEGDVGSGAGSEPHPTGRSLLCFPTDRAALWMASAMRCSS